MKLFGRHIPLPYLHVYIDLGFFMARTEVLYRCIAQDAFVIIALEIKLFGKRFCVELYRP